MRAGRSLVAAGALAAIAAPAVAAPPPWTGEWGTDEAACAFGDESGGRALRLTPTQIEEGGNRCELVDVSRLGQARWWVTAECETGLLFRRRYLFTMDGDDLVVTFLDEGWREYRFRRCP